MNFAPTPAGEPIATRYAPAFPVDVALTLAPLFRGGHGPTFRRVGTTVWLTCRTPHGPATLHLHSVRSAVDARAWGAGAEWMIAHLPALLGAGDDWAGLDVSAVPLLADARKHNPGLRLMRSGRVLEALIPAIFEQKVTSVEAWRGWRVLVTRFGDAAPGPAPHGMRVIPAPETWRLIPSWEWHRAGVDAARSRTVLRVAQLASGVERLSEAAPGPELTSKLRSVPGIGVWTAAETTQRAHGDPDSVSVGDYHLPATVGWALAGAPVDDAGMLDLLHPFAGHRQRVMRLIAASGFRKPRFGPKMTIQDHRGH